MVELDDRTLLWRFSEDESEEAFAALVRRHVDLVFSIAMRRVGNAHAVEEVAQAAFVILARKAKSLGKKSAAELASTDCRATFSRNHPGAFSVCSSTKR